MTAMPDDGGVFDLLDDCVIVRDLEGRVTFWNHAADDIYGIPRDQAIGMLIDDLFEPQTGQADRGAEWTGRASGW